MFYTLLITYVLGGLTFIPLLAALVIAYYAALPVEPKPCRPPNLEKSPLPPSTTPPRSPTLKAWLTARHTFDSSPSTYISLVRTLLDARSQHSRRAEDAYYGVLKGSVLYLYEEEAMNECAAAIDIARCDVCVFPDQDLLDGELFAKRNALCLCEHEHASTTSIGDCDARLPQQPTAMPNGTDPTVSRTPAPWYLFFRSVTVMEDWYLALLAARHPAPSIPFPHAAQQALITSLDALPDLIPTRWLNALLGRLFLGVKGTRAVEGWVIGRLMKKLSKVKKPSFLTNVVVRSFDAGDAPPVLSKPMLKELTQEGEASIGVDVSYLAPPGGEMRITISATATISLPATPSLSILGFSGRNKDRDGQKDGEKDKDSEKDRDKEKEKENAQKPYEVSLVLAVVLRRVEGNLLFKIKRPPSNRIWYAFTTMPHMEVSVEPVVSDRQIRWGMVLSVIEGKLKEIIQESVVLPYMDDIPFFDTTSYELRGGLFGDAFPADGQGVAATGTATGPEQVPTPPMTATATTASATSDAMEPVDRGRSRVPVDAGASVSVDPVRRTRSVDVPADYGGGVQGTGNEPRKGRPWSTKQEEESGADGEGELADEGDRAPGYWNGGGSARVAVSLDGGDPDEDESPMFRVSGSRTSSLSEGSPVPMSAGIVPAAGLSTSAPSPSSTIIPSSPRSPRPMTPLSRMASGRNSASPRPSSSSPGPTSPSSPHTTTSFFSTLKSRGAGIAEKQPVLKEAMRKWGAGMNWAAGLRKDKDGERDGVSREREGDADIAVDHGGVLGWRSSSYGVSPRGSYADLRKKVERREKERGREPRGDGNVSPIDIPGTRRDGNDDMASERRRTSSLHSDSSSIQRVTSSGGVPFLTPSASRTTTELHMTTPLASGSGSVTPPPRNALERRSSEQRMPSAAFPLVDDVPIPAPVPIRAQPKAATMTIPGIHERHRGAVMALGSEPVDGLGGEPADGEGQPAIGGRTMQSVYRMLRGGGAGGEGQGPAGNGETRGRSSSSLLTPASVPLPGSPTPTQTGSSVPPPLPPRAQKQPQTRQAGAAPDPLSSSSSLAEEDEVGLSPASQALKSVVQQDAARQPPPPPPLPVRRAPRGAPEDMMDAPAETASSLSVVVPPPSGSSSPSTNWVGDESANAQMPQPLPRENERWKPPLPPRKSSVLSKSDA